MSFVCDSNQLEDRDVVRTIRSYGGRIHNVYDSPSTLNLTVPLWGHLRIFLRLFQTASSSGISQFILSSSLFNRIRTSRLALPIQLRPQPCRLSKLTRCC